MIIFTKFYERSSIINANAKVLGYVYKKTKHTPEEYKGLFWSSGRKATIDDLLVMEKQFVEVGKVQMFVFSPVRVLEPEYLSKYTEDTMWKFLGYKGYLTVKFAYGLHYNTPHPHSHVIVTAYYPQEITYKRPDLYLLRDIAHEVFDEPIGMLAYERYGRVRNYAYMTGKYEKEEVKEIIKREGERLELELKGEAEEMENFNEVNSIEDIFDMEI